MHTHYGLCSALTFHFTKLSDRENSRTIQKRITPISVLFQNLYVQSNTQLRRISALLVRHLQRADTKFSLKHTAINQVTININMLSYQQCSIFEQLVAFSKMGFTQLFAKSQFFLVQKFYSLFNSTSDCCVRCMSATCIISVSFNVDIIIHVR